MVWHASWPKTIQDNQKTLKSLCQKLGISKRLVLEPAVYSTTVPNLPVVKTTPGSLFPCLLETAIVSTKLDGEELTWALSPFPMTTNNWSESNYCRPTAWIQRHGTNSGSSTLRSEYNWALSQQIRFSWLNKVSHPPWRAWLKYPFLEKWTFQFL